MSQITTHILNTATGKPASDVTLHLEQKVGAGWQTLAQGITNTDGRVVDLLAKNKLLEPGEYRMVFETAPYFEAQNSATFYPLVEIRFYIRDAAHYHIPLLLSPFGYTTYRGS
ncbi:MAG: hydroxyisourate hydrolase [Saprospiraceae bacterium]